uniref:Chemosensory protein B 38b n=2 Tax=Drosophila melanogaster TaxID=7227 RepID=Q7KT14_DROME|eukprot:NP_995735.1 chemosensory protein B 38b [Drosophila melanogaster]
MIRGLVILVLALANTWATDYNALIDDEGIYVKCSEAPAGTLGPRDVFNIDNMVMHMEPEGIYVSGNMTVKLNFLPSDRISARFSVMHYERGSWQPTMFNLHSPNFCEVMFDEDQYWFKYWFRYIRNKEEIREKCLKVKDTVLVYDEFLMVLHLENVNTSNLQGRYKAVITLEAFDEHNVRRPSSLCVEIRGDLERVT